MTGYAAKICEVSELLATLEGIDGPVADRTGAPLEIPLDHIVEDSNQPRRSFDPSSLAELAASIRERGVLQAITVTPVGVDSKHRIITGARRYRAARLAGLSTIKAVVREPSEADAYDQMIENIQRDDLSAAEIAAFVAARLAAGASQADIARRLGKDRPFVVMHAAVAAMPTLLRAHLEAAPIRGVYELYLAWRDHPHAVEAFLAERDSFTQREVRAFVSTLKPDRSRVSGLGVAPPSDGASVTEAPVAHRRATPPIEVAQETPSPAVSPAEGRTAPGATDRPSLLTLHVEHHQRTGRLRLDAAAPHGSRYGLVVFDDGELTSEVLLTELQIVALAEV